MKKYLKGLTFLSMLYAPTVVVCAQRNIHQTSFPSSVGGAVCGYKAIYDAAGQLRQLLGLEPLPAAASLFGQAGPWRALAQAQTDSAYAGEEDLESEVIRLLIERFVPEIGNNFVVMDNAQNFLGNKFVKFNAVHLQGDDVGRYTHIDQVPVERIMQARDQGRERFWAAVRGVAAQPGPQNFLFIINTSAAVRGATGGGHWYMVLFHKDAAGVHHYYVSENHAAVGGVIDQIENPGAPVASAYDIAWAFGGAEEAEEIARNERIQREREDEERRIMEEVMRASRAASQRPVAAAAAYGDEEELARVLSLSAAQARERQEEAELQRVLQESERLARTHLQQQQEKEREALELARALEASTRLAAQSIEDEEFQRILEVSKREADAALQERVRREKARRLAETQEVLDRAAQALEDAEIARAMAFSLQDQQAPVHRQGPAVAVRPPVAPRPGAQPQSAAAAVARLPMTMRERLIAQQRAELERLEREKQGKH